MPTEPALYFAYGSNMLSRRLQARVPSARAVGIGRLQAHRLRWHMPSHDGSGKCDAAHTGNADDAVWGVLFELALTERVHLDRAEGLGQAYDRSLVQVHAADTLVSAFTYRALRVGEEIAPYHWYREFVLQGAIEHALPPDYVRTLTTVISRADDDAQRQALNERVFRGA